MKKCLLAFPNGLNHEFSTFLWTWPAFVEARFTSFWESFLWKPESPLNVFFGFLPVFFLDFFFACICWGEIYELLREFFVKGREPAICQHWAHHVSTVMPDIKNTRCGKYEVWKIIKVQDILEQQYSIQGYMYNKI